MPKQTNSFIIVILILIIVQLSGCGSKTIQNSNPPNKPAPESTSSITTTTEGDTTAAPNTISKTKLTLYFPNQDASGLIPIERNVSIPENEIIKTILKELDSPPPNFTKPLPMGTSLLKATVLNNVATLDLSNEFQKNFSGGTSAEQMVLFSIVNSVTTLSNVQSVQFLLEGQKKDAILGHMDTSVPIKRNETLIKNL